MKENGKGKTHSMQGRDEKLVQNFSKKKLKGKDHLGILGTGGRIILK
jgi:hypothetical protein